MKRLFVAIWVPDEIIEALPFDKLRSVIDRQGVRFTRPERIHVTLRFLGNVLDEQESAVIDALRQGLDHVQAPALTAEAISTFPWIHRPAVVVTPVKGDLTHIHAAVIKATDPFAEMDSKPFEPHLTLARVSPPSQKVGRALLPLATAEADHAYGTWTPTEVCLVHTQGDGSYVTLATFPLAT